MYVTSCSFRLWIFKTLASAQHRLPISVLQDNALLHNDLVTYLTTHHQRKPHLTLIIFNTYRIPGMSAESEQNSSLADLMVVPSRGRLPYTLNQSQRNSA